MFALVLSLAAAYFLCAVFEKKIHETLPVAVFAVTLTVYAAGLVMPLTAGVWSAVFIVIAAVAVALLIKKGNVPSGIFSAKELVALIVPCLFFCILFVTRYAFYYDDLSYWALYAKNIHAIDALPRLFENCSVDYKDYTPVMQILQYLAMFGKRTFSESICFQTNVCFIYIILTPLLARLQKGRTAGNIATVLFYLIFPHILTAQFYYRLGVDLFLALVFGYVIYQIFIVGHQTDKKDEVFRLTAIALGLAFLSLIKTSGIVLGLLAVIFMAVYELSQHGEDGKKQSIPAIAKTAVAALFSLGSYFSWQLFLRWSGNNGYLSNRVKDGVTGGFSFPEYTGEVVLNYIKHFFTYPLTRNTIGVTAFVLVVYILLVRFLAPCRPGPADNNDKILLVCSLAGLIVFCVAHLSMYLFVFDEWEAHGLLEFDRYITQYLGGIFFVYTCILLNSASDPENRRGRVLMYISLAVFFVLLPYKDMKTYLIPSHYLEAYEEGYAKMAKEAADEWERSGIAKMNLPHDGTAKITVVANAWDEMTQFLEYTAVPQPFNRVVNVPAADPGTLTGFIMDFVDEYVYVCQNAESAYEGDWSETAAVTSDHMPLRGGTLYFVDRSNADKTLVPMD